MTAVENQRDNRRLPSGVLTFLLTDVVGSTALWERAPGLMDAALARHDRVIEAAVNSCGGIVLKHKGEGDSTFCVFETASEAIAAATEAQRRLAAESWGDVTPISVRMGIHSGESFQRDRDYYGQTVNRAARIRALAAGGQVFVSGTAAALAGSDLPDGVELPFLRQELLRGVDRLEAIHELIDHERPPGPHSVATDPPTARPPLPAALASSVPRTFAGREAVLDLIDTARADAASGQAQTILLAGEPGAGKSTIAAVAARRAHADGWTVLYGACDEHMSLPYQPFREALDQYLDWAPTSVLAEHVAAHGGELSHLTTKLAARVGALELIEAVDPETSRQLLIEAVTDLLQRAANNRPVLLVLDDLQWGDRNSILLVARLAGMNADCPIVVVGTHRPAMIDRGEFTLLLAQLQSIPSVVGVTVGGLDEPEMLALLERAATHPLTAELLPLASYLLAETNGNPLFVTELLRHLVETAVLGTDPSGIWHITIDLSTVAIPHTLRSVLHQRLSRLGNDVERVLGLASVAGRDFDSDLLAGVLERDPLSVLDAIEAAADASLVRELGVGHFEFAHALVQHALYDDLGATRRGLHHRQLAIALAKLPDGEANAGIIASHWAHTGRDDRDKVAEWAQKAGAAAIAALAPDDAVRWFHTALDAVDADDHQRLELLIALGDAQRWVDTDAFRQTLLDAAALAERLGDHPALVRAALANNRGGASQAGAIDHERVEVLERALAVVGGGDSPERARLLATLAIELHQGGDWERRIVLAGEAVACARRLGDDLTLLRVLVLTTEAVRLPSTLEQRLIDTDQLFAIAKRLGDPVLLGIAAMRVVRVKIEAAEFDQVREAMAVLDEVAHLDPYVKMNRISLRAVLAQIAGDLPLALELARDAYKVGEAESDANAVYVATAGQILWDQGDLSSMLPLLEQTLMTHPGLTGLRGVLGVAYCAAGRLDSARAILRHEVDTGFTEHSINPTWLITMSLMASLAIELDDAGAARSLYDIMNPWRGRANSSVVSSNGLVTESLAGLALVAGDLDQAGHDIADALAQAERVGARTSSTRTRLTRARWLAARGDSRLALAEARSVASDAAATGMARVRRQATALADGIEAGTEDRR